jgi:ComEC/Rec2-related protein
MSSFWLKPRLVCFVAFLAALGAALAITEIPAPWLIVPCVIAFVIGRSEKRETYQVILLTTFLVLVPICFYAYTLYRLPHPEQNDLSNWAQQKHVTFQARITQIIDEKTTTQAIVICERLVVPYTHPLCGKTLVTIYGGTFTPTVGDSIIVEGKPRLPRENKYPWEIDEKAWLAKQNIFSRVTATHVQKQITSDPLPTQQSISISISPSQTPGSPDSFGKLIDKMRSRVVAEHKRLAGEQEGSLLSSIVLGERAVQLPKEITKEFRTAGLSHMLAASGFNLTIVTAMTWWLANLIIKRQLVVHSLCFVTMIIYVLFAGPSPSVQRAALMCSLVLLARSQNRTIYSPAAIGLALIITLLICPMAISDVGLHLSYIATIGIVFGALHLARTFTDGKSHKIVSWLIQGISVVLMAQASVLPIQLLHFWQISAFFLPANLILAPLIELVTWLGFSSTFLLVAEPIQDPLDSSKGLFRPMAALIDWLAIPILRFVLFLVYSFASQEQANIILGPPSALALIAYYICLCLFLVALYRRQLRAVSFVLLSISLVGLLWRAPLSQIIIAHFPNSLLVIDCDRKAYGFGEFNRPNVQRLAAYYGAKVIDGEAEVKTHPDSNIATRINHEPHTDLFLAKGNRQRAKIDFDSIIMPCNMNPKFKRL